MKKLLFVIVLVLLMVAPAFAAGNGADQSGSFVVGGGGLAVLSGAASDTLSCGLSSNVHAVYYTDGTSATPSQWYAIGTFHLGGTEVYGTAQDVTSIYKLRAGKASGNLFTWSTAAMPADSTNSNAWSAGGWIQL